MRDAYRAYKRDYLPELDIPESTRNFDFSKIIKIKDVESANEIRRNLIHYVFNQTKLPTNEYPQNVENVENIPFRNFSANQTGQYIPIDSEYLAYVKKYSGLLPFGFEYNVFELTPKNHTRLEVIYYHQGNEGWHNVWNKQVIKQALNKGYQIVLFSLPYLQFNKVPTVVNTEVFGPLYFANLRGAEPSLFNTEDQKWAEVHFRPMLEMTNWYTSNGYKIYAIGLSGGGRSITYYSAMDDRIKTTHAVAGIAPFALTTMLREEFDLEFLKIANKLDVMILASYGEGRRYTTTWNKRGNFAVIGDMPQLFMPAVTKYASNIPGELDYIIDDSGVGHDIHPYTVKQFFTMIDTM